MLRTFLAVLFMSTALFAEAPTFAFLHGRWVAIPHPQLILSSNGAGTTTHTTGNLTSGKCVIGNGTNDLKVDASCSSDGSGAFTFASVTTSGSNGGFDATEGTGASLTAAANHDLLYPHSTAHRWVMNNNNAGAVAVVGTSTTAGTAARCIQRAANGYDIEDAAAACGTGGSTPPGLQSQQSMAFIQPRPGSTTWDGFGETMTATGGAGQTSVAASQTEGPLTSNTTNASANTGVIWAGLTTSWLWGAPLTLEAVFKVPSTSSVRYFVGWANAQSAALCQNDDPTSVGAGNRKFVGFIFSTGLSETNWMAGAGNGATAQTRVDTTVAPSTTASHRFRVVSTGATNAKFYIDGVCKASTDGSCGATVATTNFPTAGTAINFLTCGGTIGASAIAYQTGRIEIYQTQPN